ncbi:hypothetical protein Pcinc_016916 [Petrolisthes cinctipes]|uniref:CCHC-type domain-containing protein n=1 Tax=Petrolisthes cinctipes TaxID=88211 RepID=A0AAE1KP59_PETCI|nr:hypothetical protein Pcinc_016916 [Petrolisthes cinctipes]
MFVKPTNEVFVRHRLATRRQQSGETLDEYFRTLNVLSKDCNFKAVTAIQHCEEFIRDAFISGLQSPLIRQRLLENKTLDLATMFDQARALESAQKDSESYSGNSAVYPRLLSAAQENDDCELKCEMKPESPPVVSAASAKCYFCGQSRHPRSKCPARTAVCHKCQKMGHFSKVCRSPSASASVTFSDRATLATITSAAAPGVLSKAVVGILVNGTEIEGLIDSGSSGSFIHPDLVKQLNLAVQQSQSAVTLASTSFSAKATGLCTVNIKVNGRDYENVRLTVLPQLCSDVILGQDFQKLHSSVTLTYDGTLPPLVICGLGVLKVNPPELFANLTADCHPVAAKSRRYSFDDQSTGVTQEYAPGPAQVGVEVSSLEQSPSSPPQHETSEDVPAPRRSTRVRRPPIRFEAC